MQKLRHNLPSLAWAFVILILCGIPGKDLPTVDWLELIAIDKWIHLAIFSLLSFLLSRGFSKSSFPSPISLSLIISIAYGGLTELFQQAFFVGRSADMFDFLANGLGALIGCWIFQKRGSKRIST